MEATVNNITIQYEDRGSGTPIVLIHGFPLNRTMWDRQVAALATSYRVIAPDLRGFGGSTVVAGPYEMRCHADDIAALLDTLGIEKAIIGGLSMGGYVAFEFWRRYSSRVHALILAGTRATADSEEGKENREKNAEMVEAEGTRPLINAMLPNLLDPSTPKEIVGHLEDIMKKASSTAVAAALRGMKLRPDSSDILVGINVPTLVIVGQNDVLSPPSEMANLHQAIAGSSFVTIADAGHVCNFDQPEAFTSAVQNFLRDRCHM